MVTFGADRGRHVTRKADAVRVSRANQKQVSCVRTQAANDVPLVGNRIGRHDPALKPTAQQVYINTISTMSSGGHTVEQLILLYSASDQCVEQLTDVS